ncbi:MAG: Eco57I restriction-modification methylase domain-containing protein [Syntrophobacterales bacterium]|jgi:adenine-specific DNA-methyltransferase|nr:Eco57I restriction-modification methylase domain-containing protein [Syntrophobacterales bacterium]
MRLVEFAHSSGLAAIQTLQRKEQKNFGQFMTPPDVARFMAQRCLPTECPEIIRILDPAAGAGILSAAVIECLLNQARLPRQIHVMLYELDGRLIPALRKLVKRMRQRAHNRGVTLKVSINNCDFLLSPIATARKPIVDIIIANPPYFKLSATDPRALAHAYAVYGQPNIYGLFMAVCASLLAPSGRWCFITPRSWTNGLYFSSVRRYLFCWLHIDAIHVFESRRDHFTDDQILQEAMITWATAQAQTNAEIVISSSEGSSDLDQARLLRLPFNRVIGQDEERMVSLPVDMPTIDLTRWHATLFTYGLKVSTGPVVAFRAKRHIHEIASADSVPLLWMQHIKHMLIKWPINKKSEHIDSNAETAWMLVPNTNLVVIRRFSPKEDDRRITAAPYLAGTLPGTMLGLENHTNYIYRPGGELSDEETKGLAAFLNSRVVDRYLRTVAGNTQVNATDLRKLPLPSLELLVAIGRAICPGTSLLAVDTIVDSTLRPQQPRHTVAAN